MHKSTDRPCRWIAGSNGQADWKRPSGLRRSTFSRPEPRGGREQSQPHRSLPARHPPSRRVGEEARELRTSLLEDRSFCRNLAQKPRALQTGGVDDPLASSSPCASRSCACRCASSMIVAALRFASASLSRTTASCRRSVAASSSFDLCWASSIASSEASFVRDSSQRCALLRQVIQELSALLAGGDDDPFWPRARLRR